MKTTNEINYNTTNENPVVSPTSGLDGHDGRTDITTMPNTADGTPTGSWAKIGSTIALATALAGGGSFMVSCDPTEVVEPQKPVGEVPLNAEQQAFKDLLDPTNPKMIEKGRVFPSIIDG